MNVLCLTSTFHGGGAEKIARTLTGALPERGAAAHMRVMAGQTVQEGTPVSAIPYEDRPGFFSKAVWYLLSRVQDAGLEQSARPASRNVLEGLPFAPDVLHGHILRDLIRLEDLERLCRRAPVVWTLHDMWAFTGHCAHAFECNRWQAACGSCPRLDVYVPLPRDFSRINLWRRKRLYRRIAARHPGRLHLVCPSQWLGAQVEKSIARDLPVSVIPNGIDTEVFSAQGDRSALRRKRAIPDDGGLVVLFAAHQGEKNPFKDFGAFAEAARELKAGGGRLHFVVVGDRQAGGSRVPDGVSLGYITSDAQMAEVYSCADVYVHAARGEVFGLTVAEAMACGVPVVGTRVGGIPELIEDGRTGILTEPGDPSSLARAVRRLQEDPGLRRQMGSAGAQRARELFSAGRMVQQYLALYERLLRKDEARFA